MKGFVYFIIAVIVLAGLGSAFWWLADGSTAGEQLEYVCRLYTSVAGHEGLGVEFGWSRVVSMKR